MSYVEYCITRSLLEENSKVKKGKLVPVLNLFTTTLRRSMGDWGRAPPFLTSALDEGASRPFHPGKEPPVSIGEDFCFKRNPVKD
jgi:hypothetical protein